MSIREEQCNKVCRILDDVLANRTTERDSLIVAVRKAFESLEQFGNSEPLPSAQPEPCEDAVSREAVSSWLKQYGQDVLHGKYKFSLMYIWKNLMDLPSAQPVQWIPCSERLPEVGKDVMVCYDFKGHRSVLIGVLYGDEKFHGYDDEYLTPEGRKYRKAVAWMPLPEPYREERTEE